LTHNRLYQAFYGLMVCPWYAYSQTMISEVSPLPQMYVLFSWHIMLSNLQGVAKVLVLRALFGRTPLFFASWSSIKINSLSNPSAGWEDVGVHWSICVFGYHYWLGRKQQYALCIFIRTVRRFYTNTNPSKVCSVLTLNDCTVEHSAPYFYIWWMSRRVERSARSSSSLK